MLMTGDVSAKLEARAAEVGVPILHKPVRPQVLRASLVDLIRRPSAQSTSPLIGKAGVD
jgi:hypothetical protein